MTAFSWRAGSWVGLRMNSAGVPRYILSMCLNSGREMYLAYLETSSGVETGHMLIFSIKATRN